MECKIYQYNNSPHSAFNNKKTPQEVFSDQFEELRLQNEIDLLNEDELNYFTKPAEIRTVRRGWVNVYGGFYWAEGLENYHNKKVLCLIDIENPKFIDIEDLENRFVCRAELEGNRIDGMPQSDLEQQKQERRKRKLKRLENDFKRV